MLEWSGFPLNPARGFTLSQRPVLALDLGGTQIRAAVVLSDGTRATRVAAETPSDEGPGAVVDACVRLLRSARDMAPPELAGSYAGIGISSPGPVDPWRGIVLEPPNLGPAFRGIPLAREMEQGLGLPAVLDRDTNVAALGEATFGAGRGCTDFIYITVSTGIGGGVVAQGQPLHGARGLAGELGHVPVLLDGPRCGCGAIGHLEAVASGAALARAARAAADAGESAFLVARAAIIGRDELSARDVAAGEDAGDALCASLMARARRAIAAACVGFANTFDPQRIIMGGGIARAQGERLLGPVRTAVRSEAFSHIAEHVQVLEPELGPDVSLAGAHPLVMSRLGGRVATTPRASASADGAVHPSPNALSA